MKIASEAMTLFCFISLSLSLSLSLSYKLILQHPLAACQMIKSCSNADRDART